MSAETEKIPESVDAFVERRNVQMVAHFQGAGPAAGGDSFSDDPHATHWGITLAYGGRQMYTEYHMGAAHWRWTGKVRFCSLYHDVPHKAQVGGWIPQNMRPEWWALAEPIPPNVSHVLDSLRSDAECIENARDFEDFCADFGYDTDSRKAEETYEACRKIRRQLETLLGREGYAELLETERL